MDDELENLMTKAKGITMSEEERIEQRIHHVAATGNMSDERITVETTRAVHTLIEAENIPLD